MKQPINKPITAKKLAEYLNESSDKAAAISTAINQNLDKIESLPVIQKTAEKIMNDPKLMKQFQQGLENMGVNIDLMKEDKGEGISLSDISKIVSAIQTKQKSLKERFISPDEIGENPDKYITPRDPLAVAGEKQRAAELSSVDHRGGAILRGFFGMPILAGVLDYFANTGIINTISKGIGVNAALFAMMAVGGLVGGIVGAIAHKKRQKQKESLNSKQYINEVRRMQKLAGLLNENEYTPEYNEEDASKIFDYHERTGMLPEDMTEEDFNKLMSYHGIRKDKDKGYTDPAGGSGIHSHI